MAPAAALAAAKEARDGGSDRQSHQFRHGRRGAPVDPASRGRHAAHVRHWPATGDSWATVLIVHGIGEHSGRYERTGRLMSEAGLNVHAFDLRGHGLSEGRRVYVRRWDDFLDDVAERLAQVRQDGRPLALLGHSMGALIARHTSARTAPLPTCSCSARCRWVPAHQPGSASSPPS